MRPVRPPEIAMETAPEIRRDQEAHGRREQNNESSLRISPAQIAEQRQKAAENEQIRAKQTDFIHKGEQHEKNMSGGVNIPKLNAEQMHGAKSGLSDLFKNKINLMTIKIISEKDDWNR
jgi:hypothetical protein